MRRRRRPTTVHSAAAARRLSLVAGATPVLTAGGPEAADCSAQPPDNGPAPTGDRYRLGDRTCRAYIVLGIGDDDTIDTVAESEHDTQQQASAWIERVLPRTAFPDWVNARRHGLAGAYLYGGVLWGKYILDNPDNNGADNTAAVPADGITWEPDADQPCLDAELVNDGVVWIEHRPI